MAFIISEDFDLTPAIKTQVEEKVSQIKEYLRKDTPISVFLSKSGDRLFNIKFQLRVDHKDLVGSETGPDFYVALNAAKQHIVRQVVDQQKKKVTERHKKASNQIHE